PLDTRHPPSTLASAINSRPTPFPQEEHPMASSRMSGLPFFALVAILTAILNTSPAQEKPTVDTETAAAQSGDNPTLEEYAAEKIRLVVRIDDTGFNHSSNQALERLGAEDGVVTACSVIVNTGWIDETVAIANKYPHISYGVHTCLNAE